MSGVPRSRLDAHLLTGVGAGFAFGAASTFAVNPSFLLLGGIALMCIGMFTDSIARRLPDE